MAAELSKISRILEKTAAYSCSNPSSKINDVLLGLTRCLAKDISQATAPGSEGKRYVRMYSPTQC